MVIGEAELVGDEVSGGKFKFVETPFTKIANEIGKVLDFTNLIVMRQNDGILLLF